VLKCADFDSKSSKNRSSRPAITAHTPPSPPRLLPIAGLKTSRFVIVERGKGRKGREDGRGRRVGCKVLHGRGTISAKESDG